MLTVKGSGAATPLTSGVLSGLEGLKVTQSRQLKLPCRSILPHKENLNFVGRSDILAHIYSVLRPDRLPPGSIPGSQAVFALCGLGGVGKTQVAIRFVMDYLSSYQAVLFAHADEPANLLSDFARFAIELGLVDPEEPDDLYSCEQLKKWFEETGKLSLPTFAASSNCSLCLIICCRCPVAFGPRQCG